MKKLLLFALFSATIFVSIKVEAQKIILIDSLVFKGASADDIASMRLKGDTLTAMSYTDNYHEWVPNGLIKYVKINQPKRGCDQNTPFTLGLSDWHYDFSGGYLLDVQKDRVGFRDLLKYAESADDFFHSSLHTIFHKTDGNLFYLLNNSNDNYAFRTNYYTDSALLCLNIKNKTIARMGQLPSFIRKFDTKKPIYQYLHNNFQDMDTVYITYNGWPRIYKYINGLLVDSTHDVSIYQRQLIIDPICFTEKQTDSIGLMPHSSVWPYRVFNCGLIKQNNKLYKLVTGEEIGTYLVEYDTYCNLIKSSKIEFTRFKLNRIPNIGSASIFAIYRNTKRGVVVYRYKITS